MSEEIKNKRSGRYPWNTEAKHDEGKLQISLVPTQIIKDIAQVRMYGNSKYGDPDNWKTVHMNRYLDALMRHLLEVIKDPDSVDPESGIEHYKHAACNMAFICEMMSWPLSDLTTKPSCKYSKRYNPKTNTIETGKTETYKPDWTYNEDLYNQNNTTTYVKEYVGDDDF